jgi:predicted ribosome quality control (RQC) complex YloA/Tae2 family protein
MLRRAPKPNARGPANFTKNLNSFNTKLRAALLSLNNQAVTNFNRELTAFNAALPKFIKPNMAFEERLASLKQKRNAILKLQTAANSVRAKSSAFRNHASRLNKSNKITNSNIQTLNALYTSLNQNNQNLYKNMYNSLKRRNVVTEPAGQPLVPPPARLQAVNRRAFNDLVAAINSNAFTANTANQYREFKNQLVTTRNQGQVAANNINFVRANAKLNRLISNKEQGNGWQGAN